MAEETGDHHASKVERRVSKGTWPWFVLNIIAFPGPAYLTLLRNKGQSSKKNLQHVGMTFLLFLILFAAAVLQLAVPAVGRLWMLFPLLSGIVVLFFNHSLKADFKPFDFSAVTRDQKKFLFGVIFLFTIISVLPSLNLIELDQKPVEKLEGWIGNLDYWQEVLILITSLLLLFGGYLMNAAPKVSINRTFILYACFIVIEIQIILLLVLTFGWLKIQGGFWLRLTATLIAALLALDYWDARSFGQYTRRYFFLTCTKGLSFVFIILCFFGLPQKAASVFSNTYYEKVRPAAIELSPRYLIFSERDRFDSAHKAARQMRSLYARSFIDQSSEGLNTLTGIINNSKGTVMPADTDVCQLADRIGHTDQHPAVIDLEKIPQFRPIHPDWDVMLTALLMQGVISGNELDKYIAGFKTMLPNTSKGELPDIDTPYDARYVSLATGKQADFIQPRFEDMAPLLESNFYPVLSLCLAGSDYWAVLFNINRESGIAWFRIKSVDGIHKAIQLLFDANESGPLSNEIFSRMVIPVSIDYLRSTLENNSAPVIIFSNNGLAEAMPERFDRKTLAEINRAIAVSSISDRSGTQSSAPDPADFNAGGLNQYADSMLAVSQVKGMLQPKKYRSNLFAMPSATIPDLSIPGSPGVGRLHQVSKLLETHSPLCERDRVEIASLLVKHNHVYGLPELFIELASAKPLLSDLVNCRQAFRIGRQLLVLGYYKEAGNYLELAFLRHPFNSEYELWYQINRAKLKLPPESFYSPPDLEPDLALYYRTITGINNGNAEACQDRLEKVLEKDSHNSLANHLLNKYFGCPLDDRYFFTSQEGL